MFVIDVIPLSRTAPGILSYRSKQYLPIGTVVSISIRRTATQGIVVGSIPVLAAKEMLKHARFLLSRTIPSPSGILPEAILKVAERTATYHATTAGAILAAMFGEHIKAGIELPVSELVSGSGYEQKVSELPLEQRVEQYRKHIRETIAEKKAVLLIAPTLPELSFWKETLKEFKPLVLSGVLTGAKRAKALAEAVSHMGLIIATPSFSWVPVEQLGAILLDRVSAGTYVLPKRPYLSIPYAMDALAQERKIPLTLGDFPLPLEYRKADSGIGGNMGTVQVIDARRPKDEQEQSSEPWAALPSKVVEQIRTELSAGGRAIIIAARKGYAPAVVCRDCGQAQTDERGVPYSFSQAGGERVFRTSDGLVVAAKLACQRCESWNLLPLGVGIERVEEDLRKVMPEANIVVAHPELLTSPRKARTLVQDAQQARSVVIGTEALLPWLYTGRQETARAPLGVIASADSLLSQPFWRARERFVRLTYFLSGLCHDTLLVTRHPEDTAVDAAAHPESPAFWKEEAALRQTLGYPPYGTLLTLAIEGSQARANAQMKEIARRLEAHSPTLLPSRTVQGSVWRTVLVLNLPQGVWPDPELGSYIQSLPPTVRVRVDPESIW